MRVTVQQAAANAFAAWLQPQLDDVTVEPRWPSPDKRRPSKSITVVTAGRRVDLPIDLRPMGSNGWQIAACRQPFQLDVWTNSDVERDDILARLEDLIHQDQAALPGVLGATPGYGLLIKLADGWDAYGTIADFVFEEPDLDATSDSTGRSIYRATFRGESYFMLVVTQAYAKQTQINFQLALSETDQAADFPVTPIT